MLKIVDLHGSQVGDLFAFGIEDPSEHLSAAQTRSVNRRLFPRVGESFYSSRRRPLLTLIADDSPGVHDMLIPACDPARYRDLGHEGWHASCAENLERALADEGAALSSVPQPVNLFMSIPVSADGALRWLPTTTKAGASVTLRALEPLTVIVSACPQDLVDINGEHPTDLEMEVL